MEYEYRISVASWFVVQKFYLQNFDVSRDMMSNGYRQKKQFQAWKLYCSSITFALSLFFYFLVSI